MSKGEGSHGGSVIGHTRSGKAVYSAKSGHPAYKTPPKSFSEHRDWHDKHFSNFSGNDHQDAAMLHRKESAQHAQKTGNDDYPMWPIYHHQDATGYADEKMGKKSLGRQSLSKSEGSRGGSVIGHTRSGKPIYSANSSKHYPSAQDGHWKASGGKVTGYTKSGKAVYNAGHRVYTGQNQPGHAQREYKAMSHSEHAEAAEMHRKAGRSLMQQAVEADKKGDEAASQKHVEAREKHYHAAHYHDNLAHRSGSTMAKSIACPECAEPIAHKYALKSVASLAKGLGGQPQGSMAALVKGDGIKQITCPSCVAVVSPQYMVKSLGLLARQDGFDIQPALEGMFKRPAVHKSLNLPVAGAPAAFGVINRERDVMLANAIKNKGGFFGQSGLPASVEPQQSINRLAQIEENQIDTEEGIVSVS